MSGADRPDAPPSAAAPHWIAWATRDDVAPWLVAGFALLLYAGSFGGDYVLDDHPALLRHPAVNGEAPWWEVFTRAFWGQPLGGDEWSSSYRPIASLTFAIEQRITAAPWLHRLSNGLLYALGCALLTRLARRNIELPEPIALLAGLAFAALPVHVEAVAGIVGRADLLAMVGGMLAFGWAVPADGTPNWRASVAAGAAYLMALLSKESVALLPAMVLWCALFRWRVHRTPLAEALRAFGVLAVVGLTYIAWRQQVLSVGLPPWFNPADNLLVGRSGAAKVVGVLAVAGHYVELFAVPVRLCADHTYGDVVPPTSLFGEGALHAWLGLGVAALVILDAVSALRGKSRGLGVLFGLSYLLIGHVILDLSVILAERLMVWPSVWLVLWVAASVARAEIPPPARRRLGVLTGGLVLALGARSALRSLDWRDEVRLQRSSLDACPAAVHGRFNLANELRARGEAERAVWHYGVAAAGRQAFPEPFDVPAFEAEATVPLHERLLQLPELVDAPDPAQFYRGLHAYFMAQGWTAEAQVVRGLVMTRGLPP